MLSLSMTALVLSQPLCRHLAAEWLVICKVSTVSVADLTQKTVVLCKVSTIDMDMPIVSAWAHPFVCCSGPTGVLRLRKARGAQDRLSI